MASKCCTRCKSKAVGKATDGKWYCTMHLVAAVVAALDVIAANVKESLTPVHLAPSQQSRADAVADAETLNRYADTFGGSYDAIGYPRFAVPNPDPDSLDRTAIARARAAFRACPGLRGE